MHPAFEILSEEDFDIALDILGMNFGNPDLTIAPDGEPYLYRWHLVPRNKVANVYLHIQVRSDPERPLHDHPWDNTSVILSGGYEEILNTVPECGQFTESWHQRHKGDMIARKAQWAHRLLLPKGVPYAMTIFTTGPKIRDWGFWYPTGWVSHKDLCREVDGMSVHVKERDNGLRLGL